MKITALKTFVVDAFRANYVFVKIYTDDGLTGVGEGTVEMLENSVAAMIADFEAYLVGEDPFRTEFHNAILSRDSYWRTGVILRSAIAAIDGALLDIKGKALGVPVFELLGGRQRDSVPCYANAWFTGARTADEFAAKAVAAVAAGFAALKWDPFGTAYLTQTREERHRSMEIVAAVRDAVGPRVDLMIEGHGRFDVPSAISIARDLARFDPAWFEEPLPPESIDALAMVRRASPVPIATGERYYEPSRFLELIEKEAADFLQPDVSHVGGISELKRIAGMAQARYLPIAPHNPLGPIANAMTLHVAAAIPNFAWLETMMTDVPWRGQVTTEEVRFGDGRMEVPTAPGLGIDIDEAACRQHPYVRRRLRHYRGTLTDIRPPDAVPFYKTRPDPSSAPR